jgi:hypothetical protein
MHRRKEQELKRTVTTLSLVFVAIVLGASVRFSLVVAQSKNEVVFEVSHAYWFFSENDSVENVPQPRTHGWLLQIKNTEDVTAQSLVSPYITVTTDRELVNFEPSDPVVSGEEYNWNFTSELPESRLLTLSANEPNYIDYASPGFSAERHVYPETLSGLVTIQNLSLTYTLERPLPEDVNLLEIQISQHNYSVLNYTILSLNSVEDWSILPELGWRADLSRIAIGKTYHFEAQLEAVRSPDVEDNQKAKPAILIVYMHHDDLESHPAGSSLTVIHPEGLTATVSAQGEYEWAGWVSYSRQDFWFGEELPEVASPPTISAIVFLEVTASIAALGAGAAVVTYHQTRPPSSDKIGRDLEEKTRKQKEKEGKEEKKRKSKKGKPNLVWSVSVPRRITGSELSRAIINIQNRGQTAATNVLITAAATADVIMNRNTESIPSMRPNEKRQVVFPFNINERARKGTYAIQFVLKSKQMPTQVKMRYLRAVKIALLSNHQTHGYVEPLKDWLKAHSYTWSDLTSADDFLTFLKYDMIIVAPELDVSPRGTRNISNFVENGQSLLVLDKIITSEQDVLAKTLGYQSIKYEPFRSTEGQLTIVDNGHFVTRGYEVNERIPLGPYWGNGCTSKISTARTLAVQSIKREGEDGIITVPAISVNKYGKGKAFYLNFHAETSMPLLTNVLKASVEWLLSPR